MPVRTSPPKRIKIRYTSKAYRHYSLWYYQTYGTEILACSLVNSSSRIGFTRRFLEKERLPKPVVAVPNCPALLPYTRHGVYKVPEGWVPVYRFSSLVAAINA